MRGVPPALTIMAGADNRARKRCFGLVDDLGPRDRGRGRSMGGERAQGGGQCEELYSTEDHRGSFRLRCLRRLRNRRNKTLHTRQCGNEWRNNRRRAQLSLVCAMRYLVSGNIQGPRGAMRQAITAAFAGMLLLCTGGAEAAGFDCDKAASHIEQLVCKNPDLNSLDSQLEGAYLGALDRSNHPQRVKEKQATWLKERNACADEKCMLAAYSRQIQLLSSISDEPPTCSGPSTPEIDACFLEYSGRADRELARYVAAARKRLMDEAKEQPDRQAPKAALTGFDASQAAWVAYRKAECGAVYDWWSEGTIRGAMYGGCWQAITKSRTTDIWETWLRFEDTDARANQKMR